MSDIAAAFEPESLHECVAARIAARDTAASRDPAAHCATCRLRQDCYALCPRALQQVGATRRRLARGERLFRSGEASGSLYVIRSGSCKTLLLTENGREQVGAYYIPGEFVGVDGIGAERHHCEAVALEGTEVCAIPFARLEEHARRDAGVQQALYRVLTDETRRQRGVMLMLGTMRAERRLAAFLLDLSQRYRERGGSPVDLVLHLTRDEIGSFLGLKLETVSRTFSQLQQSGLLQVQGRTVKLLDTPGLERVVAAGRV